MTTLSPVTWIGNAAAVLTGSWGAVTAQTQQAEGRKGVRTLFRPLSSLAVKPLTLTPIKAKGLLFRFLTSDRSWGRWPGQASQT